MEQIQHINVFFIDFEYVISCNFQLHTTKFYKGGDNIETENRVHYFSDTAFHAIIKKICSNSVRQLLKRGFIQHIKKITAVFKSLTSYLTNFKVEFRELTHFFFLLTLRNGRCIF